MNYISTIKVNQTTTNNFSSIYYKSFIILLEKVMKQAPGVQKQK